jgi:hypothetical protein
MAVLVVVAIVVVLAVLAGTVRAGAPRSGDDGHVPGRMVTAAANRLLADRGDWGRAMLAELAHVPGRVDRWRFAAGVVRVALFPPSRRPRMVAVAVTGLVATAAATAAAAREVPSLSLFTAVLGLLLCGYATAAAARSRRLPRTPAQVTVGVVALAGLAATIACAVWTAAAHPQATTDPTHVYSVLLAIILCAYLAFTIARPRLGVHTNTTLWCALAATLACGAVWTVFALSSSAGNDRIVGYLYVTGAAAGLAVSIGVSAATDSRSAGIRAALLTAFLSAPIHFAVAITTLLRSSDYTLTDPYDQAAYPHSGFTDIAGYLLSDALGGEIIGALMLYPVVTLLCGLVGAIAGDGIHRLTTTGRERLGA